MVLQNVVEKAPLPAPFWKQTKKIILLFSLYLLRCLLAFLFISVLLALFYCVPHVWNRRRAGCLSPPGVAYLWRVPQSETATARWKPRPHWAPTSWTTQCSAPADTSGTGSGNTSAREEDAVQPQHWGLGGRPNLLKTHLKGGESDGSAQAH